jgi:hypothetical protein
MVGLHRLPERAPVQALQAENYVVELVKGCSVEKSVKVTGTAGKFTGF